MKILIVDDEPAICTGIEAILEQKDHQIHISNSGKEGLDVLSKQEMDAILLDYMMPGMDGIGFLHELRKTDKITPVIMITAQGSLQTVVEANRLGLIDYISKPIDFKALDVALDKAQQEKLKARHALAFNRIPGAKARFPGFVGNSLSVRNLVGLVEKAAARETTILINGETGTGKELVARHIHDISPRNQAPFVSVNCATLNANLLESELFGHEKGAFTGAEYQKPGLFEVADGGTLFLDEIGEMPMEIQSKLLRVLENGEFRRVGGTKTHNTDVRVVAATNRDLRQMVQEKQFREDLYYRLNVLTLNTPSLRNRTEDLPSLIEYFLKQFNASEREITPACLDALKGYSWPGNVRELRNTIERLVILGNDTIGVEDLPPHLTGMAGPDKGHLSLGDIPLVKVESMHIEDMLRRHKGNKAKVARILGVTKMTLYKKIREYQLADFFPKERR